ncbi:MAG TPA: hypothetical protein VMD28_09640 [Acidimicrobiales bacterium]|nr:hypothetical protein [Acidimicrobiales bacterium]
MSVAPPADLPIRRSTPWWSLAVVAAASACAVAIASTVAPGVATAPAGASASAHVVAQSTALCAAAGAVTRLAVRRTEAMSQNHFHFSFPASVVVHEPATVRRVARALCALPVMPAQTLHCPVDFGIRYELGFSRGQQGFRVVTLDATGCESVSGIVRTRWVARTPSFWRVLGAAMHVVHPSWTAFRGSGPTG